jgi:hypothetical protein
MKTPIASRIRICRAIAWDLFLSTVGCFVLRRCLRLVAEGGDGSGTKPIACAIGPVHDPLAYLGAALIILVSTAHKPLRLVRAASGTDSLNDA